MQQSRASAQLAFATLQHALPKSSTCRGEPITAHGADADFAERPATVGILPLMARGDSNAPDWDVAEAGDFTTVPVAGIWSFARGESKVCPAEAVNAVNVTATRALIIFDFIWCIPFTVKLHCFPFEYTAPEIIPQKIFVMNRQQLSSMNRRHFFTFTGATCAGVGAALAVIEVVLATFFCARMADFRANATDAFGELRATGHEPGCNPAGNRAVVVDRDAARHHFDIGFPQTRAGAVFTLGGASVAGLDTILVMFMHKSPVSVEQRPLPDECAATRRVLTPSRKMAKKFAGFPNIWRIIEVNQLELL